MSQTINFFKSLVHLWLSTSRHINHKHKAITKTFSPYRKYYWKNIHLLICRMFKKMFWNYYYLQSQLLVGLFAPHGASLMRLLVPRLHNPGYNMLDTKDKMVEDGFPNHGYNTDVVALILCCGEPVLASGHPRPDETPIVEHFGFSYI